MRVENTGTAWTNDYAAGSEIVIPLKNADGRYIADAETIKRVEGEGQVVFRYLEVNPNGSMNDIAGVSNERGNVVGLMPHPEHAVEAGFGPDTSLAMASGTDGLAIFTSAIRALAAV
jgi:phosphoribosylformylglycinamidine (FGAM) synthase-like amidotransferase family enzyme